MRKKGFIAALSALLAALVLTGLVSRGVFSEEQKHPPNVMPGPQVKAKQDPAAEAASMYATARSLVAYGRKHRSPVALITAAQILGGLRTTDINAKPERMSPPDSSRMAASRNMPKAKEMDPRLLLAEARKMGRGNPHVAALANQVEHALGSAQGTRGAEGGQLATTHDISLCPYCTDRYKITFVGGDEARVALASDGTTELELTAYDGYNNYLTKAYCTDQPCVVTFYPQNTGYFFVTVHNMGNNYNVYGLATN